MTWRDPRFDEERLPKIGSDPYGGKSWSALIDESEQTSLPLSAPRRAGIGCAASQPIDLRPDMASGAGGNEDARPCQRCGQGGAGAPGRGQESRQRAISNGFTENSWPPIVENSGQVGVRPSRGSFHGGRDTPRLPDYGNEDAAGRQSRTQYYQYSQPKGNAGLDEYSKPHPYWGPPPVPKPWDSTDFLSSDKIPPHKLPAPWWQPPKPILCSPYVANSCCDYYGEGAACVLRLDGLRVCMSAADLKEMQLSCEEDECGGNILYFNCYGEAKSADKPCSCKSPEKTCIDETCICKSQLFGAKPGSSCEDCPNCGTSPAGVKMGCLQTTTGKQCTECGGKCCYREYNPYTKEAGPLKCEAIPEVSCQVYAEDDFQIDVTFECIPLPKQFKKGG